MQTEDKPEIFKDEDVLYMICDGHKLSNKEYFTVRAEVMRKIAKSLKKMEIEDYYKAIQEAMKTLNIKSKKWNNYLLYGGAILGCAVVGYGGYWYGLSVGSNLTCSGARVSPPAAPPSSSSASSSPVST